MLTWKAQERRKPILLRGARQVGKTTIATALGGHYQYFVHLNLEKSADAKFFTQYGDDIKTIINAISVAHNVPLQHGQVLLFIDEIQEVPSAIPLLRYFYEEVPEVDVIAAGSLLEFALGEISTFPVGRVLQMPVNPLDFEEFLMALGEDLALENYHKIPFPEYAHDKLLQLFHEYILVGGMPEVVAGYVSFQKKLHPLRDIYSSIWDNYLLDVEKYGKSSNEKKVIYHIVSTASTVRDRITFNGFGESQYGSREVSGAFGKLQKAGVFRLVYPTTATEPPLVPNLKRKPKLQFLDTGLLNYAGNLQNEILQIKDFNHLYKGYILNHVVFQEIIACSEKVNDLPLFWTRESANANAEVDALLQYHNMVIPLEFKSGSKGSLKSLGEFMDRCPHTFAVRLLANKFNIETSRTKTGKEFTLVNLPYYCAGKLLEWMQFVVEQNSFQV